MANATYGRGPFREQLAFMQAKLNIPTRTWTDVWQDAHDTGFMVAGAYKAELLTDLRTAVTKAITDGTTIQTFRRDFDQLVEKHGWSYNGGRGWRTRIIYETNLRTSYQAGRYAQLTDPDLLVSRPFWRYEHSDFVAHPRPQHLAWDGLVLRHDDPWFITHFPPNGWGCRCRVHAESARTLKQLGKDGPDRAPAMDWQTKIVGANGPSPRAVQVPNGIDPGWGYTPGRTVAERVRAQFVDRAAVLPAPIGQAMQTALQNLPPAPPPPVLANVVDTFSTVGDFEPIEVMNALRAIPQAGEQVAKLEAFLGAHPQKALIIKQLEMGSNERNRALAPQVAAFLGHDENTAAWLYRTRRPTRTNGFTAPTYEHVVVKAKQGARADQAPPAALAATVTDAIAALTENHQAFSISTLFKIATGNHHPLTTLVHELGHQVHFWGGNVPKPDRLPALTQYAGLNMKEWHAEHFAAWVFNRAALAAWQSEIAAHIDSVVEAAINSTKKTP